MSAAALFPATPADPAQLARDLAAPLPTHSMGILFTARSGSSWLTEVLASTGKLGRPEELFNPNFVPKIAAKFGATDPATYAQVLRRQITRGDMFSFEATIFQLERTFGQPAALLPHLDAGMPWIFLRRRDLLLQAVSLARAEASRVFHRRDSGTAPGAADYDARTLSRWLAHLLRQERRSARFLARNGITAVPLFYEDMIAAGPERTAAFIGRLVRPDLDWTATQATSRHRKLGTDENARQAVRFRQTHPVRMWWTDRRRPPLAPASDLL